MWYLYVRIAEHDVTGKVMGHYWQKTRTIVRGPKPDDSENRQWRQR